MFDIKKFVKGLRILPKATLESDSQGELEVSSVDGKLNHHNGTTRSPVVTETHAATLTNKTVDSADNTITIDADEADVSNLEVDNLKSGVLSVDISASGTDTELPSAKAVRDHVAAQIASKDEASEITYDNSSSSLVATDVQAAIDEVEDRLDTAEADIVTNTTSISDHIADATDAHDATAISFDNSSSGLVATEVQSAIDEVEDRLDTAEAAITSGDSALTDHLNDATDAHDASAISNTPTGNLAATDVQSALDELQADVDTRALDSDLTDHIADTTTHGTTGEIVGTTDTQTLTNKIIQGASIESPTRLDPKKDTKANLDTYATTAENGELVFATDEKAAYQVVDGVLVSIGGGGGGLDIFLSEDFESNAAATITSGKDATFDNGGTLGGVIADEEASPIAGSRSIKYTTNATTTLSNNDFFYLTPITLDEKQKNQFVGMTFYYKWDGSDDLIKAVIWDDTNNQFLSSSLDLIKTVGSATRFSTSVFIPASCNSIKVGFQHVGVSESSKVFVVDDIELSTNPFVYKQLSNDTGWNNESADFSFTGFGTPTDVEIYTKRQGSDLVVRGYFRTGTVNATIASIVLPSKYTIKASDIPNITSSGARVGNAEQLVSGTMTTNSKMILFADGVNNNNIYFSLAANNVSYVTSSATGIYASTQGGAFEFSVPIQGWQATTEHIVTPAKSNMTDWVTYTPTIQGFGAVTSKNFWYRRVGDSIEITGTGVIGTPDASEFQITLPDSLVVSSSVAAGTSLSGFLGRSDSGIQTSLIMTAGDTFLNAGANTASLTPVGGSTIVSGGTTFSVLAKVPIQGWSSDVTFLAAVPVQKVAFLKEVQTSGTQGGTFTAGSFVTRTLNTVEGDSEIVSLSSNQFTLQAGKYVIEARAPAFAVSSHVAKLRNITDSTDDAIGTSGYAENVNGGSADSFVNAIIEITSTKVFEIQNRSGGTQATNGLGVANAYGVDEVYTQVKITKLI